MVILRQILRIVKKKRTEPEALSAFS